jgi:CBS domain-containing protein
MGGIMNVSEFDDAYEDVQRIRGALFATPISDLKLRAPVMVDAAATVADAVTAMNEHHIGCVLVQKQGRLVGIFTERDVLTRVVFRDGGLTAPVESAMTKGPQTLSAADSVAFGLNKMSVGGYRHVPITDAAGNPVGVLSVRDVVDFLVELFPEDVLSLPPSPDLGIPKSPDGG